MTGPAAPLRQGPAPAAGEHRTDFADVIGQAQARRAAEVAAAGAHHLLLIGPPGAGKTMIASRLPGILPPLENDDSLAVSAVHSLDGRFDASAGLLRTPPFENPHHTASTAAVVGGGAGLALPGAISRAHAGRALPRRGPRVPVPSAGGTARTPRDGGHHPPSGPWGHPLPGTVPVDPGRQSLPLRESVGPGQGLQLHGAAAAPLPLAALGAGAGPGRHEGRRRPGRRPTASRETARNPVP